MVQTKIIMKSIKTLILSVAAILAASLAVAQDGAPEGFSFEWSRKAMDGRRAGIIPVTAENVATALGHFDGETYVAPNGRKFKKGCTPAVAKLLIDAQPGMARVKEVIGHSPEVMLCGSPESAISDWFIDCLMDETEKLTGKKVDIGFANHGGIRIDMPKGDILLDHILSMFPFRNYPCYVALKGKDIRPIINRMAEHPSLMGCGGIRLVFKDGKVVSATVDGKPLDDNKVYGVATNNFLLNGGDGFSIARNAKEVIITDVQIKEFMVDYIRNLTAEGKEVSYKADGRITVE